MPKKSLIKAMPDVANQATGIDIDRVLEISADLFAELGFDGVSMRDISRECGCPTPTIYYHFSSKAELYQESYAQKADQCFDQICRKIECENDRKNRLKVFVEQYYDVLCGDLTLLLLMQRDVVDANSPRRHFLSHKLYEQFMDLIRRVAADALGREVSRDTAFSVSALVFGYCELATLQREFRSSSQSPNDEANERARLVNSVIAMVKGDESFKKS